MSHRRVQSNRFSMNLSSIDSTFDINDPKHQWEDIPVSKWDEVVKMFGRPTRIIQVSEGDEEADAPIAVTTMNAVSKLNRRQAAGQPLAFLSDKSMRLLRQRNFNAKEYVKAIFENEPLNQIELAIENLKGTGVSEAEIKDKIADNLHNYVKAYEDLMNTQKQFKEKRFPGQQDVNLRFIRQIMWKKVKRSNAN